MWTQASLPFGLSVVTTPSQGPRWAAMLITRVLPNSVLVPARATTRPFGRCRSGTARRTIATAWPRRRGRERAPAGLGFALAGGGRRQFGRRRS